MPHRVLNVPKDGMIRAFNEVLAARGIVVSHDAIWRFLRREGLRFKKNDVCP